MYGVPTHCNSVLKLLGMVDFLMYVGLNHVLLIVQYSLLSEIFLFRLVTNYVQSIQYVELFLSRIYWFISIKFLNFYFPLPINKGTWLFIVFAFCNAHTYIQNIVQLL